MFTLPRSTLLRLQPPPPPPRRPRWDAEEDAAPNVRGFERRRRPDPYSRAALTAPYEGPPASFYRPRQSLRDVAGKAGADAITVLDAARGAAAGGLTEGPRGVLRGAARPADYPFRNAFPFLALRLLVLNLPLCRRVDRFA